TLDLSNYTPGVYLVTLQFGEQVLTERIIKQ
ncbi:MAG: T9SS type A sorting domain-containing protein, partial [Flavobacteriales bacterium]